MNEDLNKKENEVENNDGSLDIKSAVASLYTSSYKEKENKKTNKGLVFIIIILILLILGIACYVCYDKFFKTKEPVVDNNEVNNVVINEKTPEEIKADVINKTNSILGITGNDTMGIVLYRGFMPVSINDQLTLSNKDKLHVVLSMSSKSFKKVTANDLDKVSSLVGKVSSASDDLNTWVDKYSIIDAEIIKKEYNKVFKDKLEILEYIEGCPSYYYNEDIYLEDQTSCGPSGYYMLYYFDGYEADEDKYIVKYSVALYDEFNKETYRDLSKRYILSEDELTFNNETHEFEATDEITLNHSRYWPYEFVYTKTSDGNYVLDYINSK